MSKKSTTLHPFFRERQGQSVSRSAGSHCAGSPCTSASPVGDASALQHRPRRPRTERQGCSSPARVPLLLAAKNLGSYVEEYLTEFAGGTISCRTVVKKREFLSRLVWFVAHVWAVQHPEKAVLEVGDLRSYFAYLNTSHTLAEGRWGNGRVAKQLRPATVDTHYRELCAFFNWLVKEERIAVSPMEKVQKPKVPDDQIQPLSLDQVEALLAVAKKSRYAKRDTALIELAFDTGLRASELAGLRVGDIDWQQRSFSVLGKGNKRRVVYASAKVMSDLTSYLQQEGGSVAEMDDGEFIFVSQRGTAVGEPMNRNAIYKLIKRLGKAAGIKGVRCSPHTLRHTYAVETTRNGRDPFTLQRSLGHSTLKMTSRYVNLVDADLQNAQIKTSPMDALKRRKNQRNG